MYDEAIELAEVVKHTSHVEPDVDGSWWADLAQEFRGPRVSLSAGCRSDALVAERSWLWAHFWRGRPHLRSHPRIILYHPVPLLVSQALSAKRKNSFMLRCH